MILTCLLSLLFASYNAATIWSDPLDSNNGNPINWITNTGSASSSVSPYTVNPTVECPLLNYCWQFHESASAYYISPTIGYTNISLTYSVSASGLDNGEECNIYYSIDQTTNWNLAVLTPWISNTGYLTDTVSLPLTTYNNSGVGIRLTSLHTAQNKVDDCFFQDISLNGDTITPIPTTSQPTTAIPTTSAPTTFQPTTSSPTTLAPTTQPNTPVTPNPTKNPSTNPTNNPSSNPTNNPTISPTNNPTEPTENPTRAPLAENETRGPTRAPTQVPTNVSESPSNIPTLSPSNMPTYLPVTSTKDDDEDEQGLGLEMLPNFFGVSDIVNYGIYGGIVVVILFIIICFCYCCCCKKKKRSLETRQNLSTEMAEGNNETNSADQRKLKRINSGSYDNGPGGSKYDKKSIDENAKRTNALDKNFWKEESESRDKHRVVAEWKETGSNVADSEINLVNNKNYGYEQKSNMQPLNEMQPVYHEPPVNLAQMFGRKPTDQNEPDSDDESLMRKQHLYNESYDPETQQWVVDKNESKEDENKESKGNENEQDSDDESLMRTQQQYNENNELKSNEYITPRRDMDLNESEDENENNYVNDDDSLYVDDNLGNVLLNDEGEDEQKTDEYVTPI